MFEALQSAVRDLAASGHPYFESNTIPIETRGLALNRIEHTELLRSSTYSDFCFETRVIAMKEALCGSTVLELSSGNNDLGHFEYLLNLPLAPLRRSNYYSSNYSGGRGDWFALQHLLAIENAQYQQSSGERGTYSIDNVCITIGGQGALSIVARFLAQKSQVKRKVVVCDSTFCGNYRPFVREGLRLEFVTSGEQSFLPEEEDLLQALTDADVAAVMIVGFHNPSGERFSEATLRKVFAVAAERGIYVISSEVFDSLALGESATDTPAALTLRLQRETGLTKLVRIKSMSKERGLAGIRAGYMLAPEELVRFGIVFHDALCYNPPMISTPLIVLNEYLRYRSAGGAPLPSVEEWLGEDESLYDIERFKKESAAQRQAVADNLSLVGEALLGRPVSIDDGGCYLQGDDVDLLVPEGGINVIVRLKFLESFDQFDILRKVYLAHGLILHASHCSWNKPGMWARITLSHPAERIRSSVQALNEVRQHASCYDFLPQNSVRAVVVQRQARQRTSRRRSSNRLAVLPEVAQP